MSCCGPDPDAAGLAEVSRLVSGKLAAFLRTLRAAHVPLTERPKPCKFLQFC